MPDASFLQSNFTGGEWSPFAQGRADEQSYRTAMNVCLNAVPTEEGAWTRRSGSQFAATTRNGVRAVLKAFDFTQTLPYDLEFTPDHMRLFAGPSLVVENEHTVASISSANPASVNTPVAHGYSTGDQVQFVVTFLPGFNPGGAAYLYNRQFAITVTDANDFTLSDPITGDTIDGSLINVTGATVTVARIVDFATVYTASMIADNAIRVVQSETVALVLNQSVRPYALTNTGLDATAGFETFDWASAWPTTPPPQGSNASLFQDGPYLDPPTDGSFLTPSALSGTINLTASSIASINNGTGFQSTDVARFIRLYSEPPTWSSSTTYSTGSRVKYNGGYYQATATSTNIEPDADPGTHWFISTTAAVYTWGIIQSVISTSEVSVTLAEADPNVLLAGGPLLYSLPILTWQLGVYSDTTGWPTGGTYHEGRFLLFGAIQNRIDASMSNQPFLFSPSMIDNTVADNNAIAAVLEATDVNTIYWAIAGSGGVVLGTLAGEWLLQASALGDPLTPTSIQAHRVTRYGDANVEPRQTGLSIVFVERYQRKVYEYLADSWSGKNIGTNIAIKAKHLTEAGLQEIVYQREPNPIIWGRDPNGQLVGCTYKRESPFSSQPASFMGWHRHALGSGRTITSIQEGPSPDGTTDSVSMVTLSADTGIYFVEFFAPFFDETGSLLTAQFVDTAVCPTAAYINGGDVIFYGLYYLAGETISVWLGGVDCGDYVVAANGSITMPLGAGGGVLTAGYLQSLTGGSYGNINLNIEVTPPGQGFSAPFGSLTDYTTSSSSPSSYPQIAQSVVFDWDAQVFYTMQGQQSGDPGTNSRSLFVFDIGTFAQLEGPLDPGVLGYSNSTCLGYDGHIYFCNGTSTQFNRFNTTTNTVDLTYFKSDIGTIGPPPVVIDLGGISYVWGISSNSGTGGGSSSQWWIVVMADVEQNEVTNGFFDEEFTSLSPSNAILCRGPEGSAFALCWDEAETTIGLYRAVVEGPLFAGVGRVGSVPVSELDASWSGAQPSCIVYDETDGNIVGLFVQSGGSQCVIAKVDAWTGAVLWSIPVNGGNDFHTARIRFGLLNYIGADTIYQIDTLAGTATSTSETVLGGQPFSTDDLYGQIVANINDIGTQSWASPGPAANSGPGTTTPALVYNAPALLGFTFTSQGQILRAIVPQEAGAANGPAMAKTRRTHQVGILMSLTQGISVGTTFDNLRAANLVSNGGDGTIPLTLQQLFSGIYWDTIDDTYSFNGMVCWQISRPYPASILSVNQFLHTQDR